MHKIVATTILGIVSMGTVVAIVLQTQGLPTIRERVCDGKTITESCVDEEGIRYKKYLWHDAVSAVEKEVYHPAEPAKTHQVYHEAVYGTRKVRECIRTSISYKSGTCALSQCRDGSYSGSAGRGTCSYHGGVARSGGPWYVYRDESYVIKPAWTETVVDWPAKEAWTEKVIVTPAAEAYLEKIPL